MSLAVLVKLHLRFLASLYDCSGDNECVEIETIEYENANYDRQISAYLSMSVVGDGSRRHRRHNSLVCRVVRRLPQRRVLAVLELGGGLWSPSMNIKRMVMTANNLVKPSLFVTTKLMIPRPQE
jgi:hypothetical protein